MYFYFDIETTYTQDATTRQKILEGIHPPGNMSKPETIAKWEVEKKPDAIREALNSSALKGGQGEITAIGYAIDNGPIHATVRREPGPETEQALLEEFARVRQPEGPVIIVAHNADFDLRFTLQRAIIHGVRLPIWYPKHWNPWNDRRIFDTQAAWAGREHVSQAELCRLLGIEKRQTIDGSQCPQVWVDGDYEAIEQHNREDIRELRLIHRRMVKAGMGE